jgi:hypothetical protein
LAAQPTFRPIALQLISAILALRLVGWLGWLFFRVCQLPSVKAFTEQEKDR